MADIFDVVADSTRRDLLSALLTRYVATDDRDGEISVSELVEQVGISQPTVSKHLKVLREHGLVSVREEGQHRYYRLDSSPLESIEDWLIPFLSADFDENELEPAYDPGATAFAAWAGAEAGENIGRTLAEGSHKVRTVIHDASEAAKHLPDAVKDLPDTVRRRLFGED